MRKRFNELSDEQLIDLYAETYGISKFNLSTESQSVNLREYREAIIERMNLAPVTSVQLSELVTDEQIIVHGKQVKETFELLKNELNLHPDKLNKKARIIAVMDKSGSMGSWERYIGKSFIFWIEKLLDLKYSNLQTHFVGYHTSGKDMSKEEFYSTNESGGTITSNGLTIVNDTINNYDYEAEDTYVFLISDGDNLTSDNNKLIRTMRDIVGKSKKFYYLETNQYHRSSTIAAAIKKSNFSDDNFKSYIIQEKADVYTVIKALFNK